MIASPPLVISIPTFTSSLSTCGTISYVATYSDNSPLDVAVFTFNSALKTLSVSTSDTINYGGVTKTIKITAT